MWRCAGFAFVPQLLALAMPRTLGSCWYRKPGIFEDIKLDCKLLEGHNNHFVVRLSKRMTRLTCLLVRRLVERGTFVVLDPFGPPARRSLCPQTIVNAPQEWISVLTSQSKVNKVCVLSYLCT